MRRRLETAAGYVLAHPWLYIALVFILVLLLALYSRGSASDDFSRF